MFKIFKKLLIFCFVYHLKNFEKCNRVNDGFDANIVNNVNLHVFGQVHWGHMTHI